MIVVVRTGGFLLETVLQLQLTVRRETISGRDIDLTEIVPPTFIILDPVEELLIPAHCAENLRREFIFRL